MRRGNFQRYTWTFVYVVSGIAIGAACVWYFCSSEKLNAFSLLLWSFAYLVIGALIGFIFSIPKIITESSAGQIITNPQGERIEKNRVEENTNLTQVSDWLTKVLLGAGLVQIKEAPSFVLHVAKVMGQGIRKAPVEMNVIDAATIICGAVILYFITWGFISGYLVMKLVLTEQFANSNGTNT